MCMNQLKIKVTTSFLHITLKFCYENSIQRSGEKIISNKQLRMRLCEPSNDTGVKFAMSRNFKSTTVS